MKLYYFVTVLSSRSITR